MTQAAIGTANPTPPTMALYAKRVGRKPGADPTSEASRKPWIDAGVSERTWHRRKKVAATKPSEQHAAHVVVWFATLSAIARLEHRAFVRRCFIARAR